MGGCFTKKVSAEEREYTDAEDNDENPDNSFGQYRTEDFDAVGNPKTSKPPHKLLGRDVSHIKIPVLHLNSDELPRPDLGIDVSNNYDAIDSRRVLQDIIDMQSHADLDTVPVNVVL